MANPWFRLYSEFAHDPKVQIMPEHMQRRYIMLMCFRCNGDETLHETEIAFALRISDDELTATKALFISKGFIDEHWNLLNWDKRQFSSDSSAARVARHREKKKQGCNGNETLHETKCNALDTDTDTDKENLKDMSSPSASTKPKNGTRLPDDWVLPKAWGEWALTERPDLTADHVRKVAENFRDHWIANANRKEGRKADWQAAWRLWFRKGYELPPNKGSPARAEIKTAQDFANWRPPGA